MPPKSKAKGQKAKAKGQLTTAPTKEGMEKLFGKSKSTALVSQPEFQEPEVDEPVLQPKPEEPKVEESKVEEQPKPEESQKVDVPVEDPKDIITESKPTVRLVEESHGIDVPEQSELVEGLKQTGEKTMMELKEMGVSKAQELVSTVQKKIMEYPTVSKLALIGGIGIPIAIGAAVVGREIYEHVKEKLEEKEKPKEEK